MIGYRVIAAALTGAVASVALAHAALAYDKAALSGRAAAAQAVSFDIYLPIRDRAGLERLEAAQHDPASPQYQRWLTPEEFNARFGPDLATVATVTRELRARGLEVLSVHTHGFHVAGTVGAVERAFGTELAQGRFRSGRPVLAAVRPLTLTPTLAARGAVIPAFAGTIRMHPTSVRLPDALPANRDSPYGGYWFDDLKQAYAYPSYKAYTGKGVTIGILMSAGYSAKDTAAYFAHEKLAAPAISEIDLYGATPYDTKNPFNSGETQLDIQQAGGMAPGAKIIHYNLPDLYDDSILGGLTTIIEGNATVPGNVADVVNMSFGEGEAAYTPPYNNGTDLSGFIRIYDDMFAQGNAQGITFVASAGDLGGLELPAAACFATGAKAGCGGMIVSASTPATSPHVTGVGGTNLKTTYSKTSLSSAYVAEAANGDPLTSDIFYGTPASGAYWGSGGGESIYFLKPAYQRLIETGSPARAVPDLALHMGGCPQGAVQEATNCGGTRSYVAVAIDGTFYGYVGTSASAPDFTGLLALKIERRGHRLGNENDEIYRLAAAQAAGSGVTVFRTDIKGYNGVFHTSPGYNMVLGNGTLYGSAFIGAPSGALAGIPQTPSNP